MKVWKFFNHFFILFIIFLFVILFIKNIDKNTIKANLYSNSFAKMNVIVDLKSKQDVFLNKDNELYSIQIFNNIANKTIENKTKTLKLYIKNKNQINNILIFNGVKSHYFQSFNNLNKKSICINNHCEIYDELSLDNSISKLNKNSHYINYYSHLNTFCVFILSIFHINTIYLLPYFLIFAFIAFKKEKLFNSKYFVYFVPMILFVIAILLRINRLFDNLFILDEYYTIQTITSNFIDCFKDAGNPPFYYLLLKTIFCIVPMNFISLKCFEIVVSIISTSIFWLCIKKLTCIKTANLALLLYSINIPLIYYAQELRCYSIEPIIIILSIYFVSLTLNKNKIIYYIYYTIIGIISINTHYWNVLFVLFCSIWMFFNVKKENLKKVIISNAIIFISILPYFLYTSLNQALLNTNFNIWLPQMNIELIFRCLKFIFGTTLSILFSIFYFIISYQNKEKTKQKQIATFCISGIIFIFLSSIIISYLYRTILIERYTIILIILFIIYLSTIYDFKKKILNICFIIWILASQQNNFNINYHHKGIVEMPLSYSKQFINKNKNKKVRLYFSDFTKKVFDFKEYYKYKDNAISYSTTSKENLEKIRPKNYIIFTTMQSNSIDFSNLPIGYTCYFNSEADICLWKIEAPKNLGAE